MSHNDDLLLVTACRDALADWYPTTSHHRLTEVTSAALSLIEDTLIAHDPEDDLCELQRPCTDYARAVTALHAIATALGVDQE